MSPLLDGVRAVELGGRAAAVCGRLFAQLGADVLAIHAPGACVGADAEIGESLLLQANKRHLTVNLHAADQRAAVWDLLKGANLFVVDLPTAEVDTLGLTPAGLRELNPALVSVLITPFGLSGPRRNYRGGDLVAFHSSGIGRHLFGVVDDPESDPPARAAGRQSDFIVGLTAACAAMNAIYREERTGVGEVIDISDQEAMSLMTAGELAQPAFGGHARSRQGKTRGGNAIGPRLPTSDGWVAISPREVGQWAAWLHLLGDPEWGSDARFATSADRAKNYDELFDLMSEWSISRTRNEIAQVCQERHIPAFPFGSAADRLHDPQLESRKFFEPMERPGAETVLVPDPPFGLPKTDYVRPIAASMGDVAWSPRPAEFSREQAAKAGTLPLEGVRVLDFSWVIAGPTGTRYLALMGAEVIKIENPSRPDNARSGTLHNVVGQSKLGMSIDLKADGALDAVRRLVKSADAVVENFASGVMDRLGLGYEELRAIRPDIILLSSSGLGGFGPDAGWVAYGSLLDAYVGFLDQARVGRPPKSGMAWIDPLSGLFLGFAVVAALRERDRSGKGRHLDFSMVEGVLWTMPEVLMAAQIPGVQIHPAGNVCANHAPHNIYRAAGDDRWLAVAVTTDDEWRALCTVVPATAPLVGLLERQRIARRTEIDDMLSAWARERDPFEAMDVLQQAGVPASATYSAEDLFKDAHLRARGFYRPVRESDGVERLLPSLPWHWGDDTLVQPHYAPGQGEHNYLVLVDLAGLSEVENSALEVAGAFGKSSS